MPSIALIGPGAIGGTLAAWLLQKPDNDLTICARTPFETLSVDSPFGSFELSPKVVTEPDALQPCDWVVIATKTYQIKEAAKLLDRLQHSDTRVAVVQNGVEHLSHMAPFVDRDKLVPVIIDCPIERSVPGKILQRDAIEMTVPNNAVSAAFASLFPAEHITTTLTDDWTTAAWKKLCINSGGAVSALLNKPSNVVKDPNAASIMRNIILECAAVGRAEGAAIEDSIAEQVIAKEADRPDGAMNSIHADLVAKRPMEWDARNGIVARLGMKHGIPTPCNEMTAALLSALETANLKS